MATESEIRDTLARSPGFTGLDRVTFADNATATRAFEQLNQILSTRFGKRSPFAERAVTWADLQQYGFATLKTPSGGIINIDGGVTFPDPIPVPADPAQDPSVPPAPAGLTVTGAVVTMILDWTTPAFSYFGFTEVWRASADNLSLAVKIGQTNAALYADAVGQESTTYFYWIRHVSKAGNAGPYNSSAGTSSVTSAGGAAAIADGSITTVKLASLAVSSAKIADGAIVNAKIGTAAITNANIADLAVTDAKIASLSVGKMTAGALAVAQFIQSFSYNPGVAGWRIHADGSAEFNSVSVRGTVTAAIPGYPTVEFGNDVGPGTGHYGLSLSGTDFNNIFLRRADGIVFFRVNSGGASSLEFDSASGGLTMKGTLTASDINASIVRNADSTSYLDLRPGTPSGYLLNTPNAKIFANGTTRFSNQVGEGVYAVPYEQQFFGNGEVRDFYFSVGQVYNHDSGQFFGAWTAVAEAIGGGSLVVTGPGMTNAVIFSCEASVAMWAIARTVNNGTDILPSNGSEVYVRVRVTAALLIPQVNTLRLYFIRWRAFKVT